MSADDQVICIRDPVIESWQEIGDAPVKGRIYTIIRVFRDNGAVYYNLQEIPEDGWHERLFRPVKRTKTDLSILRSILNPSNHKVLEDA